MILPNTFDTTPFVLSNLKPKQLSFVTFLMESAGHTNATEVVFKRNYLKNVAQAWGSEWAPAWVVKDVSRVTNRGFYAIPELTELINNSTTVTTDSVSPGQGNEGDDLADTVYTEDNPHTDVNVQAHEELINA